MHPTDKAARVAGALYLSLIVTGPFSLMYVPTKLIVKGDATATANNIRASEMLLRTGIVAELIGTVLFLFVALALYRLLSGVNRNLASVMVILASLSVPIAFLDELNELAALLLVRGAGFLAVFDRHQLDALAMLFVKLHGQGIQINEMFWGLWLFPFGLLVMRSRFLPRILGVLLLVNGVAYVAVSLLSLLWPSYPDLVDKLAMIAELGEIWITLWLLIKGARVDRLTPAIAESGLQPQLEH